MSVSVLCSLPWHCFSSRRQHACRFHWFHCLEVGRLCRLLCLTISGVLFAAIALHGYGSGMVARLLSATDEMGPLTATSGSSEQSCRAQSREYFQQVSAAVIASDEAGATEQSKSRFAFANLGTCQASHIRAAHYRSRRLHSTANSGGEVFIEPACCQHRQRDSLRTSPPASASQESHRPKTCLR